MWFLKYVYRSRKVYLDSENPILLFSLSDAHIKEKIQYCKEINTQTQIMFCNLSLTISQFTLILNLTININVCNI